jgi:hypothetical protein
MTSPTAITRPNSSQPFSSLSAHSAVGNPAATEVKMSSDMPLPMPRSVISSPNHITTAVPAVMVTTITRIRTSVSWGTRSSAQFGNSRPGSRATAIRVVDWRMASATVR